jgi:capsular polysaccharide biosynthesis protein
MWGGLSAWRSVSGRRFAAAGGAMSSDLSGGNAPVMTMPPLGAHLRRKAWKILLALVLLGAVATFAYKLANPIYESTAVIKIKATNAQEAGKYLGPLISSVESRSSLVRIMDDENLYIVKRTQVPLDDVIEEMKRNIRIEPLGNGVAARIGFTYRDRHVAQRVTEALVLRFVAESSAGGSAAAISILDPANLPESTVGRLPSVDDSLSFAVGLFFGALFGVILVVLFRLFRRSPVPA